MHPKHLKMEGEKYMACSTSMQIHRPSKRSLAILLLTLVMSGCKIVILSHNVGEVATESGKNSCPALQSCIIDVTDIYFNEVFLGSATHPNYRFKGWLKGERHLCGGSEAACALSTEQFPGNDILMGILESEEPFFLIPEFERIGEVETAVLEYIDDGKPQVTNASGEIIGSIEHWPGDEWARAINIRLEGYAQPYSIPIEYDSLSYLLAIPVNPLVYESDSCEVTTLPGLLPSDQPAFGIVPGPGSPAPIVVGAQGQYFIVDPVGTPISMSWNSKWSAQDSWNCLSEVGESDRLAPLVPIDIALEFPLKFTDYEGIERFIEFYDVVL